jgi:glycerol uptake facilitator-like aquaporin
VRLLRLAVAETLGTAILTMAVIGSGITAVRLSPGDAGLQLLESSLATGAVLAALIATFGSVSAAFNPVVSAVQAVLGDIGGTVAATLVLGQVVGAGIGAMLANLMFDLDPIAISRHPSA